VEAFTVTFADAVNRMIPWDSSLIELPLESSISTDPGPSLRISFWPARRLQLQSLLAVLVLAS